MTNKDVEREFYAIAAANRDLFRHELRHQRAKKMAFRVAVAAVFTATFVYAVRDDTKKK